MASGVLGIFGAVLIIVALLTYDKSEPFAIAALTLGVGLVAFGVLLPRLEGKIRLGPSGFEGVLGATREKVKETADEKGLTRDEAVEAYENAVKELLTEPKVVRIGQAVERSVAHGVDAVLVKRGDDSIGIQIEERAQVEKFDDDESRA